MATYLQNIGLPPELIQALPYLVTILGFIVVTLIRDRRESIRKRQLLEGKLPKGSLKPIAVGGSNGNGSLGGGAA
jgi:hypothetical protein